MPSTAQIKILEHFRIECMKENYINRRKNGRGSAPGKLLEFPSDTIGEPRRDTLTDDIHTV